LAPFCPKPSWERPPRSMPALAAAAAPGASTSSASPLARVGLCCACLVVALPVALQRPSSLFLSQQPVPGKDAAAAAQASGRRSVLTLGGVAAAAAVSGGAMEGAWADYTGNPWPYDVSRAKIAGKLGPFTGTGCPDPLVKLTMGTGYFDGDQADTLKFTPDKIDLVQGCYTELAMVNPSGELEHNFIAPNFVKSVHSLVVLAGSPPAEIKGAIGELELKPGASLGWFLVPMKTGTFQYSCTVTGHSEAGMVGQIRILPRSN